MALPAAGFAAGSVRDADVTVNRANRELGGVVCDCPPDPSPLFALDAFEPRLEFRGVAGFHLTM